MKMDANKLTFYYLMGVMALAVLLGLVALVMSNL